MRRLLKSLLVVFWIAAGGLSLALRKLQGPRADVAGEAARADAGAGAGKIRRRLLKGGALLAVLAAGGLGVAASGIVPIKASSGHWAITAWFLNFSMSRSVSTHSLGVKAPPLDDPRLVLKGAGHYETGCRPCHGAPDLRHPRVPRGMTPHPPYLPRVLSQWESEELFYIVKHGVKFTGMPAWPAQQRDDEVWAMVAFLRTFPDLDAAAYRRLANGEAASGGETPPLAGLLEPEAVPPAVAENCGRCHGVDGRGRGEGAFPRLAGQRVAYLAAALHAYARGTRHSGVMEPIAAGLSPAAIVELARYYGRLRSSAPSPADRPPAEAMERGEVIAHQGIPAQKVPACTHCHGPTEHPRRDVYPLLAGQYAEYLVLQLELFKNGHRGGTRYAHLMHPVATQLTQQQMRDVALYYASLASE